MFARIIHPELFKTTSYSVRLSIRIITDIVTALRFLTRLPVPGPRVMRNPARRLAAFPLAGLTIGLLLAVVTSRSLRSRSRRSPATSCWSWRWC